jgi:hypothetical protein
LPYLDIKNADVFEPVKYLCHKYINVSHTVAITLLKIKLLLDLTALRDSAVVGERVPREILDGIQAYLLRSPIIARNRDIMEHRDHTTAINKLTAQIDALYKTVKKANEYLWPSLLEPGRHLTARPNAYTHGGMEQMQLVLQYSYDSWVETPGAMEVIKAKVRDEST